MTRRSGRKIAVGFVTLVALVGVAAATAQIFGGGRGGRGGGRMGRAPVPITEDRKGVPDWQVDPRFKSDVFTFARIEYDSGGWGGFGRGGGWRTDYPDSDLNFSYRLQQLTSLKVNPLPVTLRLTDPKLFDYPFIYMIEIRSLELAPDEVAALRKYLLNGGFLMVDDFWGDRAYQNLCDQLKQVFPDREPVELNSEHEIFHNVYRLKEKPQVPNIDAAIAGRSTNTTWEWNHDGDTSKVHYQALFDDNNRMMAILCHNTDLGDGWEREGEDPWYFKEFAEKRAYPMGINIITYAMTH